MHFFDQLGEILSDVGGDAKFAEQVRDAQGAKQKIELLKNEISRQTIPLVFDADTMLAQSESEPKYRAMVLNEIFKLHPFIAQKLCLHK